MPVCRGARTPEIRNKTKRIGIDSVHFFFGVRLLEMCITALCARTVTRLHCEPSINLCFRFGRTWLCVHLCAGPHALSFLVCPIWCARPLCVPFLCGEKWKGRASCHKELCIYYVYKLKCQMAFCWHCE